MSGKTKNVLIIILSLLFLLSLGVIAYLIVSKNNTEREIVGTVIVADKEYVIIESNREDYLIRGIKEAYGLGDEVKFTYKEKNLDNTNSPKSIDIEKEEIINKAISKPNIVEEPEEPTTNPNTSSNTKPSTTKPIEKPKADADTEVLSYFNSLKSDFDASTIKESVKNGFITVVDFIFYNGTIKGHTFKDLSDSAKLKVLSMALYFDNKIETYFPGYKESISSTTNKIYTTIKDEIVTTYLNVAAKVCENNDELCTTAKEEFGSLKKNFGLTWSLIKDIAGDGLDKLKTWYEIFSGK